MKKKLEADLISIAHRILKLKNRSELDQLLQETRNLYEKLSVLRFVEDNFSEVKPTIGYASAEAKLEEVYGIKEEPAEEGQDKKTDDIKEDKKPEASENQDNEGSKTDEVKQDDENKEGEGVKTDAGEGAPASEKEKEYTKEETDEDVKESNKESEPKQELADKEQPEPENKEAEMPNDENAEDNKPEEDKFKEPEAKPEGNADPGQKIEEYQASEEEKQHTEEKKDEEEDNNEDTPAQQPQVEEKPEQQEQPKVEEPPKQQARPQFNFDFDHRDDASKKEEITFENYSKNYKEPEFVKKSDVKEPVNVQREWLPKEPEVVQNQEEKVQNMWGNTQQQPTQQSQQQANDIPALRNGETISKVIALGLNDRIAFEKNLFNGSGEDLNRVISQLNTVDRFADAKNFINDLVKPDYNNWKDKEEYEERFMALVEQSFK